MIRYIPCAEWRSARQETSGNAKGSRICREGNGEGKGGIEQERRRNRKAVAAHADDTGGTELQGETNQRTSRVSHFKRFRHNKKFILIRNLFVYIK